MSKETGIQWTDHTWNPWQGCFKVSPGCAKCYMYRDKLRYGQKPDVVVRSAKATFTAPLKWNEPARVFTCSWSDFFIEEADPWRNEAWDIIRRTPHLTYQILTKRPERIVGHLPIDWPLDGYENVYLGISAESQPFYERRWSYLREVPLTWQRTFLSAEPLLGPIDLGNFPVPGWVIGGGETGKPDDVRFTDNQWLRSLRDQCKRMEVPFFLKQITSGGRQIPFDRWPEDLRVREFPNGM